jgi:DNA-binding transcriptional ArsR family regulator
MSPDLLAKTVRLAVTPRFDVFYALRTLHDNGDFGRSWRTQARQFIPTKFEAAVDRVAPRAMMWPLLADALRDAKPELAFDEITDTVRSLDNESFQRAILGGIFRGVGVVDGLINKRLSLRAAASVEVRNGNQLMSLVGLEPFHRSGAVIGAFTRIVSSPTEYRADLARALEIFWESVFQRTWQQLEPQMRERMAEMRAANRAGALREVGEKYRLPVLFDDKSKTIRSTRGATLYSYRDVRAIHLLPSAFNDLRFWGAYSNTAGSATLYFPVFDATLIQRVVLPSRSRRPEHTNDPALGFRALGDTTRYAIASVLAREPRTSAELAKEFNVSKATISHHVQLLRGAGLLSEEQTEKGTVLRLDREVLESLSGNAAHEMFSGSDNPVIRRSRHAKNTGKQGTAE